MSKTFQCEKCGGRFPDNTSEGELRAEYRANFPELSDVEFRRDVDTVELCSRCFREFMAWFRTMTDIDKRLMREAYRRRQRAEGIQ